MCAVRKGRRLCVSHPLCFLEELNTGYRDAGYYGRDPMVQEFAGTGVIDRALPEG